jgi:hypothetical protein
MSKLRALRNGAKQGFFDDDSFQFVGIVSFCNVRPRDLTDMERAFIMGAAVEFALNRRV